MCDFWRIELLNVNISTSSKTVSRLPDSFGRIYSSGTSSGVLVRSSVASCLVGVFGLQCSVLVLDSHSLLAVFLRVSPAERSLSVSKENMDPLSENILNLCKGSFDKDIDVAIEACKLNAPELVRPETFLR